MNSNNQMIQKGKISSVEGKADRNGDKTTARVLPSTADSMVTRPLTIPWYLRGEMGNLTPGTEVAYAMFEDGTGIILSRMDGEWDGIVPGDITVKKGALTMQDKGHQRPVGRRDRHGHQPDQPHPHRQHGRRHFWPAVRRDRHGRHGFMERQDVGRLQPEDRRPERRLLQRRARHGKQRRQGRIPGHQDQKALKLQSMSFDFDLASAVGGDARGSSSRGRRWSGSTPPSIWPAGASARPIFSSPASVSQTPHSTTSAGS